MLVEPPNDNIALFIGRALHMLSISRRWNKVTGDFPKQKYFEDKNTHEQKYKKDSNLRNWDTK